MVVVKLVVVRSGQPTLNQQASASERLGLQSSAAPTSPQGLEGRLAERADPSSPSCPLIGAFGKSGRVLMGHHHQTVSNARTAEGTLFAREEVCRCEGRSEGGTEGRREGERERGRKGEREKGRKRERGRRGGEENGGGARAQEEYSRWPEVATICYSPPYYYRSRGGRPQNRSLWLACSIATVGIWCCWEAVLAGLVH